MEDENLALVLQQCLDNGTRLQWESFIAMAQPVIAAGVVRGLRRLSTFDRELADDLIQDTFVRICADHFRVLRNFRGGESNSLRVYLKVIANSIVIDHFRSAEAKPAVDIEDIAGRLASEDKSYIQFEQERLLTHVEKCLAGVDPRSYQLFWLYHRQGLRPKEIASFPGIGMGTDGVETAVYRLTRKVRDCLRKAGVLELARSREGGLA